jgi:uncharacterized protein (TIGR02466 family)
MDEMFELFPTPVMRCTSLLSASLLKTLANEYLTAATLENSTSGDLFHTRMLKPNESESIVQLIDLVIPKVTELGVHILGEELTWSVKDLWVNVMRHGARQAIHNHANSLISGIVYLTDSHPSASTKFTRALGGNMFVLNHRHAGSQVGPFNADQWISPVPDQGDILLFPSGLLHEVPQNLGQVRASLAFNAIPRQIRAWDYSLSLE